MILILAWFAEDVAVDMTIYLLYYNSSDNPWFKQCQVISTRHSYIIDRYCVSTLVVDLTIIRAYIMELRSILYYSIQ